MSAPSKEEIAEQVSKSRSYIKYTTARELEPPIRDRVITALADENERLRAERAECITLLERIFEEHEKAPDYWDRPLEEIAGSAVALLAKLRGQP